MFLISSFYRELLLAKWTSDPNTAVGRGPLSFLYFDVSTLHVIKTLTLCISTEISLNLGAHLPNPHTLACGVLQGSVLCFPPVRCLHLSTQQTHFLLSLLIISSVQLTNYSMDSYIFQYKSLFNSISQDLSHRNLSSFLPSLRFRHTKSST